MNRSERLNEFALGATHRRTEDGPLYNAVTTSGNDVDDNVQDAVDGNDTSTAQYVI